MLNQITSIRNLFKVAILALLLFIATSIYKVHDKLNNVESYLDAIYMELSTELNDLNRVLEMTQYNSVRLLELYESAITNKEDKGTE